MKVQEGEEILHELGPESAVLNFGPPAEPGANRYGGDKRRRGFYLSKWCDGSHPTTL